jgi:hypothetical protein
MTRLMTTLLLLSACSSSAETRDVDADDLRPAELTTDMRPIKTADLMTTAQDLTHAHEADLAGPIPDLAEPPVDLTPPPEPGCITDRCTPAVGCKDGLACIGGECRPRPCSASDNPCPGLGLTCINGACWGSAGQACDTCSRLCYSGRGGWSCSGNGICH